MEREGRAWIEKSPGKSRVSTIGHGWRKGTEMNLFLHEELQALEVEGRENLIT